MIMGALDFCFLWGFIGYYVYLCVVGVLLCAQFGFLGALADSVLMLVDLSCCSGFMGLVCFLCLLTLVCYKFV